MKTPESLLPALHSGIIQEVVRPLMSGKEAQIYVVVSDDTECVAKVYKEASQRTFKHRAEYTEGRRTRNTRDQRAVNKRTRHGRKQDEAGWRSTEVDMIYRLRDAGVRVPEPINFVDGVLVMELVKDAQGNPAPRLGDLRFEASEAVRIYQQLVREVVRMLSADVIHGDLSDFNVLLAADGPVLIDFPQAVHAASNQNARKLLIRDVENLHRFAKRYAPEQATRPYAQEMWSRYEAGRLEPDSELQGDWRAPERKADIGEVIALIEDADRDEEARREARGEEPRVAIKPLRTVVDFTKELTPRPRGTRRNPPAPKPDSAQAASATGDGAAKKRRNRRRRRSGPPASGDTSAKTTAARAPESQTQARQQPPAGSGESAGPRGRRRRPRNRSRSESGEGQAAQPRSQRPAKPLKPDANPRGAGPSATSAGESDRPARRRRRRPRRPDSSGPR